MTAKKHPLLKREPIYTSVVERFTFCSVIMVMMLGAALFGYNVRVHSEKERTNLAEIVSKPLMCFENIRFDRVKANEWVPYILPNDQRIISHHWVVTRIGKLELTADGGLHSEGWDVCHEDGGPIPDMNVVLAMEDAFHVEILRRIKNISVIQEENNAHYSYTDHRSCLDRDSK